MEDRSNTLYPLYAFMAMIHVANKRPDLKEKDLLTEDFIPRRFKKGLHGYFDEIKQEFKDIEKSNNPSL